MIDKLKQFWNYLESLAYKLPTIDNKSKLIPRVPVQLLDNKPVQLPTPKYNEAVINRDKMRKDINSRNIAIPYIPEKRIKLTNAGKLTGAEFSTNMLDSIAKYGAKVGLPIELAIGLAALESALGNANTNGYLKLKDRGVIYGSSLISNWLHGKDNPWNDLIATANRKAKIRKTGEINLDLRELIIKDGWNYAERQAKEFNTDVNVLEHGFNLFKTGKYNPGDPNHTKDVINAGKDALQSPLILKWLKTQNYYK